MIKEKNIQERANQNYSTFAEIWRGDVEAASQYDDPTRYEEALERLQQDPLSFEKLITNHRTEEITWEILLSTGGPASRILVTTQEGSVTEADYQFQDWFEPWTSATNQDEDLVKSYAEVVGLYEED